jgi:alginate O-acetyltransferase complex protein AlgJ
MTDGPNPRVMVAVFAVCIAIPLVAGVAGFSMKKSAAEVSDDDKTAATTIPWFQKFDERFPFRGALIHAYARTSLAMGVSPSPTVIRGSDGWLYYADDSALDDYISASPLSASELNDWRDAILQTRDTLRALGIAYVFVVAPDKHIIYPEHMPASIHPLRREHRLEQLTEYLQRTTDVAVVDLRMPLLEAKRQEQVYFRTDSHWDEAGAYVAYRELLRAASRQIASLTPAPRSAFRTWTETWEGGDIAEMLGVRRDMHEDVPVVRPAGGWRAHVVEPAPMSEAGFEVGRVVTSIPDPALPRLLMIRDSFGSRLIPFLSEHFSRAVYLWQMNLDMDDVKTERPTIVIQEIVGRRLQTYQP